MDEEERRDKREDNRVVSQLKDDVKKKSKSTFKMWLKKILIALLTSKVGIILIVVIAVVAIIAATVHILDIRGSTDVTDVATETIITENTEIKPAPNPADGYYFQISDDVVEKFLEELNRAYYEGRYLDHIKTGIGDERYKDRDGDVNEIANNIASNISNINAINQSDFIYDPETADIKEKDIQEWFNTKDYEEYLVKFIRAEIASMYPKLGNYAGGNTGGKDNPRDSERQICSTRCSANSKNTYESRPERLNHQ